MLARFFNPCRVPIAGRTRRGAALSQLCLRYLCSAKNLSNLVNLERYPIHNLECERGVALVQECRSALSQTGFCVLPHFLNSAGLNTLLGESLDLVPNCYKAANSANLWNEDVDNYDDHKYSETHLRRRENEFISGNIASDELTVNSTLKALQNWDVLLRFTEQILAQDAETPPQRVYPFADELASCIIRVLAHGQKQSWRFSSHALEAALVLQKPESGGAIRVLPSLGPKLDAQEKEALYAIDVLLDAEEVQDELQGVDITLSLDEVLQELDTDLDENFFKKGPFSIQRPPLQPGTLIILAGPKALTSFSSVGGSRPLLLAVLHFSRLAGARLSSAERRRIFGRVRTGEERELSELEGAETGQHSTTEIWSLGEDGEARRSTSGPLHDLLARTSEQHSGSAQASPQHPVVPLPSAPGEFSYLEGERAAKTK